VLEFVDPNISPDEFAKFCCRLLTLFHDQHRQPPFLAWEKPGPGVIFTMRMKEARYPCCYCENGETGIVEACGASREPSWNPRPAAKLVLLAEYKRALSVRDFVNHSERALKDTLAWKYDRNGNPAYGRANESDDPSGARNNHGDLTMSDGLCWKMMQMHAVSQQQKKTEECLPITSLAWRNFYHEHLQRQRQQSSWVT
jgi:hypothetical protein